MKKKYEEEEEEEEEEEVRARCVLGLFVQIVAFYQASDVFVQIKRISTHPCIERSPGWPRLCAKPKLLQVSRDEAAFVSQLKMALCE